MLIFRTVIEFNTFMHIDLHGFIYSCLHILNLYKYTYYCIYYKWKPKITTKILLRNHKKRKNEKKKSYHMYLLDMNESTRIISNAT